MSAVCICLRNGHYVVVSSGQDDCRNFCVSFGARSQLRPNHHQVILLCCPRKQLRVASAVPTAFWGQYNQMNPTMVETVASTSPR